MEHLWGSLSYFWGLASLWSPPPICFLAQDKHFIKHFITLYTHTHTHSSGPAQPEEREHEQGVVTITESPKHAADTWAGEKHGLWPGLSYFRVITVQPTPCLPRAQRCPECLLSVPSGRSTLGRGCTIHCPPSQSDLSNPGSLRMASVYHMLPPKNYWKDEGRKELLQFVKYFGNYTRLI